jgi:hypothetical protein
MKNPVTILGIALLSALLLVSLSIHAQKKSTQGFVLKGNITGAADGTKVRLVDIDGQKILDSAVINHGAFIMQGHVNEPTSCWLQCNNEYAILEVENTAMTITSPLKEMKLNYLAQGGREQSLQSGLDKLQRNYERIYTYAYDSLNNKQYTDTIIRRD